jgi:ribosomal protein S18 acetylase RimI-like enzyme
VTSVLVREVTSDDWETLRDVRLAALREAPTAFASTYAREAPFTEQQWRGQIGHGGASFLGYLPGHPEPAGIGRVYESDGEAHMVSLWVRPSARGHAVGEALIDATVDWARARAFAALTLWVTESNAAARRLYERCDFALTGERQPLPSDPALPEVKMRRLL